MMIPAGCVLITDDGRGLAGEIAGRLADFEVDVRIVNPAETDLTDAGAVNELLSRVRDENGSIGGFIHLAPLAQADDTGNVGPFGLTGM